ncbi:MAG: type II toxin-antitoxin system VapC family toxin [Candidatus Methylomirabilales bacterium]
MPEPICLDASIIIALVVAEPATERLNALWVAWATEGRRLVAPRLLPFEVAAALERKMRKGELESNLARMALSAAELLAAVIEQPEIVGGLGMAWDLAGAYRLRLLDACYLAIAQQEGADLWTLDRELASRAGGKTP